MQRPTSTVHDMVPMLICNDVQASIKFYVDALGFRVVNRMDNVGDTGWASLNKGTIQIMLTSPSYYDPPQRPLKGPLTDTVYYYYVENIVEFKEDLVRRDIKTSEFAVRFYGMKEFEIEDPDGRLIIVGEQTEEPPTPE